jgi:N-acyl-D-amino-acid deacylase
MTGLPAHRFGLAERGLVAPGYHADLTLFDPDAIIDTATFAQPMTPAAGIMSVWVSGVETWRDGAATGARAGRAIRRA